MAHTKVEITTAPNSTAYDASYPTRSTELYCNQVHNVLQDLDDAGDWWISDRVPSATTQNDIETWVHDTIEDVFDYAAQAIEDHRAEDEISITKPTKTSISEPTVWLYNLYTPWMWKHYADCMRYMYLIYYMWKTENDPLLLKEKLQELLIAWPLQDTTIELNEDMGQQFKVYPSWKSAEL